MGRLIPSASILQHQLCRASQVPLSSKIRKPKLYGDKLSPEILRSSTASPSPSSSSSSSSSSSPKIRSTVDAAKMQKGPEEMQERIPLSEVVADCVKRWFQDTLHEAKSGDSAMQILVGQMYFRGYGVPRDVQKGKAWFAKASKSRSSAWKVSDKHPGYNASDSDSDEDDVRAK